MGWTPDEAGAFVTGARLKMLCIALLAHSWVLGLQKAWLVEEESWLLYYGSSLLSMVPYNFQTEHTWKKPNVVSGKSLPQLVLSSSPTVEKKGTT